ncbi:MAG: hypothetical protein V2A79_07340 [Planctomycetota bacterium]
MRTYCWWVTGLLGLSAVMGVSCTSHNERLNAPPQGSSPAPSELQDNYTFMLDNAMLEDMCLADIHFVPHTAEINGLGMRRLLRYGELLKDHGGTLHLETTSPDNDLTEMRLLNIRAVLASTGLEMANVSVKPGLPRGRVTEGADALRIKREGTVNDYGKESQSSGASAGGSSKGS